MSMDVLVQKYQQLRKLAKEAAERARNAWWSARAVEAEKLAWNAKKSGRVAP